MKHKSYNIFGNKMSITGLHSNVSRNVVAKNSIKLVDANGVEIFDIDSGF